MLKRRAVHKDMAEANVYAARRLKDMAQSLGGLAKTFGRCREEPGLSREDGIAALEAASAMVCGACESCGIQRECRRGGDDENYYLIAYDSSEGIIKHFRVDKMIYIKSNGKGREGRQVFKSFDMAAYARKMFGMYGGKEEWVRIECDNSFAGVMIDRFGKDVSMIRLDDKRFVVNVEVAVSRQFLAWIISLGEGVTLVGPDNVVEMMNIEIDRLIKQYKK